MKRMIKKIVVMSLAFSILMNHGVMAHASEGIDDFYMYEEKLEELNNELGTTYQLTPAAGESYEDMVNYFSAMSMEEFEEYIKDCYESEVEFICRRLNPA